MNEEDFMIKQYRNYLKFKRVFMTLNKIFNVCKDFAEGLCIGYGVFAILKRIYEYFKIKQLRREYAEQQNKEEEERKEKSIFSK